jgi:hypothetical protein
VAPASPVQRPAGEEVDHPQLRAIARQALAQRRHRLDAGALEGVERGHRRRLAGLRHALQQGAEGPAGADALDQVVCRLRRPVVGAVEPGQRIEAVLVAEVEQPGLAPVVEQVARRPVPLEVARPVQRNPGLEQLAQRAQVVDRRRPALSTQGVTSTPSARLPYSACSTPGAACPAARRTASSR